MNTDNPKAMSLILALLFNILALQAMAHHLLLLQILATLAGALNLFAYCVYLVSDIRHAIRTRKERRS